MNFEMVDLVSEFEYQNEQSFIDQNSGLFPPRSGDNTIQWCCLAGEETQDTQSFCLSSPDNLVVSALLHQNFQTYFESDVALSGVELEGGWLRFDPKMVWGGRREETFRAGQEGSGLVQRERLGGGALGLVKSGETPVSDGDTGRGRHSVPTIVELSIGTEWRHLSRRLSTEINDLHRNPGNAFRSISGVCNGSIRNDLACPNVNDVGMSKS